VWGSAIVTGLAGYNSQLEVVHNFFLVQDNSFHRSSGLPCSRSALLVQFLGFLVHNWILEAWLSYLV